MNDNSRLKDMSSMNESSYFFDELNKDEEALHNCSTVKAYNMWPHIINQGKIFSYQMQFLNCAISDYKPESPEESRNEAKFDKFGIQDA